MIRLLLFKYNVLLPTIIKKILCSSFEFKLYISSSKFVYIGISSEKELLKT